MTTHRSTIRVDQFIAASPETVWRTLTEPELVARWWAPGNIAAVVGHEFTLEMPGFGAQPCRVLEAERPSRFVYTFTENWTLTWSLHPEGHGTRLLLEHSGFDLDDTRMAAAFERMGPGWRDVVLPRLAELAPTV
ncbi:SRPBCC domain-containing protein [Gordonia sp. OPL2]|uniref:SRPBCC family protein n=1 Tax=Gordonia sp. OPL2 TaxID=2486274 RepID=UPI001656804F|nr:SRPBCC domain-containing protein [Gordonia sp. OPL2]ROZ98284.1 SRPBCC domain-containing protein [Gordonia sp. OPL2]